MSNEISKQEYLKRYLEGDKKKNKKKSKIKTSKLSRFKIIDQDIGIKSIGLGDKDVDELDEQPVVAEIIDDRPLEIQLEELYGSARWKKISNDEASHSDVPDLRNKYTNSPEEPTKIIKRNRHDSDSDISLPRSQTGQKKCLSDDVDMSSKRGRSRRHDSDNDISPPRSQTKLKNHESDDVSMSSKRSRSRRHDSDSDISPPRSQTNLKKHDTDDVAKSSKRGRSNRYDSDSDISPPRSQTNLKKHETDDVAKSSKRGRSIRRDSDSDISPPRSQTRQKKHKSDDGAMSSSKRSKSRRHEDSDSDLSPPRTQSSKNENGKYQDQKPRKTLSGLKAGLQDSGTLRREVEDLRKKEKTQINMMEESVSGRNAETIVRDRKTGLRRDFEQEQRDKDVENKKTEEHKKKYMEWGKGLVQTQTQMEKLAEDLYEVSKPLARYGDDEDLDARLKAVIRDEDPMSAYIRKKKEKEKPSLPAYSGPSAPPNRFGIPPGYRWDGVDRSNGFEQKCFEKINSNKATQEESYLWSIQDM